MSSLHARITGQLPSVVVRTISTSGRFAVSTFFLSLGLAAAAWRRLRHGGTATPPATDAAAPSPARPQPARRTLSDGGPIVVGVCAMDKKARSQPMNEMLHLLTSYSAHGRSEFRVVYFGDDTLLNKPIEEWPLCEALIAFFSTGFPLQKAQAYVALRKPFAFNDLSKQGLLFDRREFYRTLQETGVPVPHFTVFDASRGADNVVDEQEDYLEINGVRIQKPLVEKPVSGEDHNVYIYYPRSLGGGSKRLFRKVGDRSSQFYPEEHLTRIHDGGSYIYEELLQTEVRNSDAILRNSAQFCAML